MATQRYSFAGEFKETYMSQQKPALDAEARQLKMQLQSQPPLGQVTRARGGDTALVAVLHVEQPRQEDRWEVALWFSLDGAEWDEAVLAPAEAASRPQTLQALPGSPSRLYFTTALCIATSMQFTLKFCNGPGETWRWIRDEYGLEDGLVVVAPSSFPPDSFAGLIPDLNHDWKTTSHASHLPQTRLWSLQVPIPPAIRDQSSFKDIAIGTPWGSYLRYAQTCPAAITVSRALACRLCPFSLPSSQACSRSPVSPLLSWAAAPPPSSPKGLKCLPR